MSDTGPEGEGEGGAQSRMGWTPGGGGGYTAPPPYQGGYHGGGVPVGTAGVPGGGFAYPPVPGGGAAPPHNMYPNIGFNPAIFGGQQPQHQYTAPQHLPPQQQYMAPPIPVNRQMECPICQRPLAPPIYQCSDGHTLCSVCIERLDYCTVNNCMDPLEGDRIRNFALEQQLMGGQQGQFGLGGQHQYQNVAQVQCPHARNGCPVLIPGEHLNGHLEVCQFRGFPFCSKFLKGWTSAPDCTQIVHSSFLLQHLIDDHQLDTTDLQKFIIKLIAPSRHLISAHADHQPIIWNPLIIKLDSQPEDEGHHRHTHILLKCFISPQGNLTISGHLLPTSYHPLPWKQCKIKFQIDSSSKAARLEWTGGLIYDSFNDPDLISNQFRPNINTFQTPISSLKEFLQPTKNLEDEPSSKIKIKCYLWKLGYGQDQVNPFVSEMTTEEPQENLTFFSKIPEYSLNEFEMTPRMAPVDYSEEEYANYYSPDASCNNCNNLLYGGIIYQCLQCPPGSLATYFCKNCIENVNAHDEHLTVRISKPSLQPLAAVAYECSGGELH